MATLMNLNGCLCAQVIGLSGTVKRPVVERIESRGGTTQAIYTIDMNTGRVVD